MERNIFIADLLQVITTEYWKEIKHLETEYYEDLLEIDFLRSQELYNLKLVLNEIGYLIHENKTPYELSMYNEGKEYPAASLNYAGKTLIKALTDNGILNFKEAKIDSIKKEDWFKSIIMDEVYKGLYQKIQYRFNKIKENYPDDYIIYKKKLKKESKKTEKIKWKSNIGDLGYIFKRLAKLDYYEFPMTHTKSPQKNLGAMADYLINIFVVLDEKNNIYVEPNRKTLSEYLGDGEKKDEEKISVFNDAWKFANYKDDERIFNLPPREYLGKKLD